MSEIDASLRIAASGLHAQGMRLRVVAENLANASSIGASPEELPYRRQVVSFRNVFDREIGASTVEIGRVSRDTSEFVRRYEPGSPAADQAGYVRYPNVNPLIEMMDMRDAQRSYDANLSVIESARSMLQGMVDLLR